MLRAAFAVVAVCVGLSFVVAQPPKPAVTMDDIKKAWQERQDRISTLNMKWSQSVTYPRGALDLTIYSATGVKPKTPQPPQDTSLQGHGEVILSDNSSYAINMDSLVWSAVTMKPERRDVQAIYDGKQHTLNERNATKAGIPNAFVGPPSRVAIEVSSVGNYPIWWFCRGNDSFLNRVVLDDFSWTGRVVNKSGRACFELEYLNRSSASTRRLYVTTEHGNVPVAMTVTQNDKLTLVLDIHYTDDPTLGVRPSGWKYVTAGLDGKTRESAQFTVTAFTVNPPLAPTSFTPQLLPRTVVTEEHRDGTFSQSVVSDDGTASEPTRFSRLPHLDGSSLVNSPKRNWLAIAVLCLGAILLVAVTVKLARIRLRSRNTAD